MPPIDGILDFLVARRYVIGFAVLVVAAIAFLPWVGPGLKKAADVARNNLPLTLPILMVAISIFVRLHELVEARGWLGLCNRLASGFVTFSIWAMVSGASAKQYIWINDQRCWTEATPLSSSYPPSDL
jgi:hypothetical protein